MCSIFWFLIVLLGVNIVFISYTSAYLLLLTDTDSPGKVIFNASTAQPSKIPRQYTLNIHKSAPAVKRLFKVESSTGVVTLNKKLQCDGVKYPNLFTIYVDSLSNATLDYISFPLRILIHGCEDLDFDGDLNQVRLSEAKKWPSDTLATFSVPIPDYEAGALPVPPRHICLRRSQLIVNLAESLLPATLSQSPHRSHSHRCAVRYVDTDDARFAVESRGGDLVSTEDWCVPTEPPARVKVTIDYQCDSSRSREVDGEGEGQLLVSPAVHYIKVYFTYLKSENDSLRVRRDTQKRLPPPSFERALYIASVTEEQAAGVSVCAITAREAASSVGGGLQYNMVSLLDSRSQAMFGIDSKTGIVTTLTSLDRELLDVHYFRVTAQDNSFPPRSATTTLQVNVLDANDHAPVFEAVGAEYQTQVRESAPVGTTVTTVRATDKDVGHNAQVEYSVVSVDGGGLDKKADVFSLDARSGVLSTRLPLDRERTQVYTVIVAATDQALPPGARKSSTATVVVKILDDNDNYPQFVERTYTVNIPEDTNWKDNPVIATVKATDIDEGQNAAIRYAIIGGNVQGQFSIDSQNGEVTLVKPLDYESMRSYRITIRAQDGGSPGRSNTTQLLVNVKDVNDNAPRFYTSLFQESVSENVPVGYSIVRVQAYDADEGENALIKYSLKPVSSTNSDLPITVDSDTGWLHTKRALDREVSAKFQFHVLAIDGGSPSKTATASVVVTVQDVNDNDPVFSPKQYEAVVAEDDTPGTPVANVVATDPDENPRLHYEITGGNTRGRFAVTTQNGRGLVTIAQPLDYKQEKRFVLMVRATDSGGRFDTATVYVNVSDANNFPPVFDNAPYAASVFEDAPVGTTVLIVAATDGDVGENAHIIYSLQSTLGESADFAINAQTGAITTLRLLDRETQSGYLLTVSARDNGAPPLSDTTDVEISVADVNDNKPRFASDAYTGSVPEDALVGTSVVQISATDADVGLNGRIVYALSEGVEAFVMDATSGVVRTAKALDRESVARYEIWALAIDRGAPPLTGSVLVTINIEDVNDSPPAFESDKLVLYIAENSPVGSTVGEILARDADEGANAAVHYSIVGGEDSNSFSLVRRPASQGAELLTMVELDYESSHKRYELVIRAASPPLRTDVHVEVMVTDVNDNAPVLKNFQVMFNNFRDCFPGGAFGRIPAFDADVTDQLHYRIVSGNNANLVHLNETTGMLSLSPQLNTNVPKIATMEISVTDGVNEVKSSMQLMVRLVTDEMLLSSVTVRLGDMTEQAFLSPLLAYFTEGLAAIIPCPKDNIYIFSIQDDTDVNARILNVSFSARRPDGQFYSPQYLQERVYLNRGVLARLATVQVLPFDDNLCVREPCLNFERCLTVLKFGNASGFISSDTVLFRPIYPVSTFACRCPEGFTGSREHYLCDTEVNLCYSYPCQNEGTCHRSEGGYTCVCKPGYAGTNCEIDLSSDVCKPGICHSGSTCSPLTTGGFVCDDCAPAGTFEHYNQLCQLRGRSFPKNSFLTFRSLKQRHRLHIALKFATLAESGLLLYNGRYNEQHDFIALEIIESGAAVQFSFSLGSDVTRVAARLKGGVNDGHWHSVTVDYFNKSASISLDDCDTALTIKYGDKLGESCANKSSQVLESRCAILIETCHRFLDLTGPLQIGGLPSLPSSTTFQVRNKDFIGCIADLNIDHKLIDLNSYVADNGTVIGCPQRKSYCVSEPCLNGGTCTDDWGTFHCDCPQGWSGKDCSQSISPAWRFHGDSLLSFNPLLRPILLPWLVGISIRTLQSTAFLMSVQVGQNSSAVLSLDGGMVVFTLDGQKAVLVSGKVNDGKWHRIEVYWNVGGIVTLTLDNGRRSAAKTLNAKLEGLYVGRIAVGSTEDDVDKKLGFNGCVQDVRIGTSQSILQRATVKVGVTDGCIDPDPCAEHSCTPHSQCVPDWETYSCQCQTGFVGPTCKSVCDINPCDHEGVCVEDRSQLRGYACHCNGSQYSGEYCEQVVSQVCPATWWGKPVCGPCRCDVDKGYGADCNKTTGECYCRENHYQPPGSDRCIPCNCYAIGSFGPDCDSTTGQCRCRTGVLGQACDICPSPVAEVTLRGCEVVYDACPRNFAGGLWWPRTKFGEEAVENCPAGSQGKAARVCDDATGQWLSPNVFNCTSDHFVDLRRLLNQLEAGDVGITTFVAVEASNTLQKATNSTTHLFGADVLITEQLIDRLLLYESTQFGLNLTHSQDKDYIQNVVSATSQIVNEKLTSLWLKIEEITGENAETLLFTVESYLKTLALNQRDTFTDPFEVISENMALGLDVVTYESLFGYESESLSVDVFPGSSGKESEKVIIPDTSNIVQPLVQHVGTSKTPSRSSSPAVIFPKYNNYIQDASKFDKSSHVMIPIEMLGIKQNKQGEHNAGGKESKQGQAIVGYAQYKTLGKVLPMRYDMTVVSRWGVDLVVASPVFTLVAIIMDEKTGIHSLSDSIPLPAPVRFRLWLNEDVRSPRANPQCVHWTNARGFGEWSRAGCHTELPSGNWWRKCSHRYNSDSCKTKTANSPPVLINCTCNHLSSFAVIVDLINDDYLVETTVGEEFATWVAFCLSLWALAMATFMLSLLRAKTNSSAIYTNQALTLLLAELLYLIALKARTSLVSSDVPCKLIAMALHYLWLCALSWWLVGSIHLYRMLTEVRDVNHGPMRFYYCLGYSLPAVVVCLAIGVRTDQYGNIFFCWLSLYESVIWSMIGPACLIVTVNLLVLMFSLRAAFTVKDHVAGYGNLRRLLWLNVVSLPLVTACWLLCLIAATEHDPALTYALSATIVAQAWFLLFGYCLGNARVRSSLYRLVLQMLGRKVPPLDVDDDDDHDGFQAGNRSTTPRGLQPTRSALAYRSGGVGGVTSTGGFDAARRHIGISTSSTTSRSTTKTGSSPYRSDTQLRQTSTSTSNYEASASDVPGSLLQRPTQHTSDSESEVSADGRSLELASSHSSDDDESSTTRQQRQQRRSAHRNLPPTTLGVGEGGVASAGSGYLPPNIRCDSAQSTASGAGTGAGGPATLVQPPPHLNIIANSELFKPIYAPRWPSQTYSTVEQVALDESFVPHRWTNMSGSTTMTMSDNELARSDLKLNNDPYYQTHPHPHPHHNMHHHHNLHHHHHPREPSLSDADEVKSNIGEKYLFPYTAEEDHCSSSSPGVMRPYSSHSHRSHSQLSDVVLGHHPFVQQMPPPLPPSHPPPSSPSPLLLHPTDFACPDISETEKDTSETPV